MDVCGEIATQLKNVNIVNWWRMDQAKAGFELGRSKTKRTLKRFFLSFFLFSFSFFLDGGWIRTWPFEDKKETI